MAKLNIDIGVNLGTATRDLGTLKMAFSQVNEEIAKVSSNLKNLNNIKAAPTVTITTKNVSQNNIVNSSSGNISQPTFKQVPDIFADYRRGMTEASDVAQFLLSRQESLTAQLAKLQSIASKAGNLSTYEAAIGKISAKKQELDAVGQSLSRIGNTNAAQGLGRLSGAANQANITLTNVGRIAQDIPYGFIGISNNLNPLVESFRDLSIQAKASGTSIGKELLKSLSGFGGVGIVISAVSAALSFASIGLSYWTRNSAKAKDENEKLAESFKKAKESATEQGLQLQNLLAIASDSTKPIEQQNAAFDKLSGSFKEYGVNLSKAAIENGTAKIAVDNLTQALIQQSIAAEGTKELGKLLVEKQTKIQERKDIIDVPAVKEAVKIINQYRETLQSADSESAGARSSLKSRIDNLVKPYDLSYISLKALVDGQAEYEQSLASIDKRVEKIKKVYNDASTAASVFQQKAVASTASTTSRIEILNKKIADEIRNRDAATKSYGKGSKQYDEITAKIKGYEAELDKIQGKENRSRTNRVKPTFTSGLKELQADLKVIENTPTLNLFEKDIEKVKVLDSGIKKLRDDFPTEAFASPELKGLEALQSKLEFKNFGAGILKNSAEIESKIKSLKENATLYEEPVLKRTRGLIINTLIDIDNKKEEIKNKPIVDDASGATFKAYQDDLKILDDQTIKWSNDLKTVDFAIATQEIKNLAINFSAAINKINLKEISLGKLLSRDKANLAFKALEDVSKVKGNDIGKSLAMAFLQGYADRMSKKADIEEPIQKIKDDLEAKGYFVPLKPKFNKEAWEQYASFVETEFASIQEVVNGGVDAIGNAFQGAFEGKNDIIGRFFVDILGTLGKAVMDFGKKALVLTTAWNALKKNLFGPIGPVAAIGLIAVGAALIAVSQKMAKRQGFARGGYVNGPGHSTSDSIPAVLSNGEYVLKASAVRKFGTGYLDRLNQGRGFADGGLASIFTSGSRALVNRSDMPSFNPIKTNTADMMRGNNGYIAETKISGQDLKLVLSRADRRYSNVT